MPVRIKQVIRKRQVSMVPCPGDEAPEICNDSAGCLAVISNLTKDEEDNYLLHTTGTIGGYVRATVVAGGTTTTPWQALGTPITLVPFLFVNEYTITLEVSNDVEEEKYVCDSVTVTVQEYTDEEFEGGEETYNLDSVFTLPACTGTETFTVFETDADDTAIAGTSITITDADPESQTVILHKCNGAVLSILVLNTVEAAAPELGLRLTYTPGNLPANDLAAWNTFFDLPANGTAFTSMSTAGDEVTLIGGAGITIKQALFRTSATLLKIEDDVDCVTAVAGGKDLGALSSCTNLTTIVLNGVLDAGEEGIHNNTLLATVSMTALTTAGDNCFALNPALATFSLPALVTAGAQCFNQSPLMNFFDGINNNVCPLLTSSGSSCFAFNTATPVFVLNGLTTVPQSLLTNCSCTTVSFAFCTDLGGTTGDNSVFLNCLNLTDVYVPTALATVDGGNPDGDLVYANGTLGATIHYL